MGNKFCEMEVLPSCVSTVFCSAAITCWDASVVGLGGFSPRAVAHFAGSSVGCVMVLYRVRSELSCSLPLARLGPGVRQLDSLRSIAVSDLDPWD